MTPQTTTGQGVTSTPCPESGEGGIRTPGAISDTQHFQIAPNRFHNAVANLYLQRYHVVKKSLTKTLVSSSVFFVPSEIHLFPDNLVTFW